SKPNCSPKPTNLMGLTPSVTASWKSPLPSSLSKTGEAIRCVCSERQSPGPGSLQLSIQRNLAADEFIETHYFQLRISSHVTGCFRKKFDERLVRPLVTKIFPPMRHQHRQPLRV